jgi:flavoprotein
MTCIEVLDDREVMRTDGYTPIALERASPVNQTMQSVSAGFIVRTSPTVRSVDMSDDTCERCFSTLYECPDCKGQTSTSLLGGTLTCSTCRSTGKLCPTDGGHWQR